MSTLIAPSILTAPRRLESQQTDKIAFETAMFFHPSRQIQGKFTNYRSTSNHELHASDYMQRTHNEREEVVLTFLFPSIVLILKLDVDKPGWGLIPSKGSYMAQSPSV